MATFEKRISSKGTISYRAKVRRKGHLTHTATFQRLTDAKRWVTQTESSIDAGKYLTGPKPIPHNLNDAIDRYSNEVIHQLGDIVNRARHLAWWQSVLGEINLEDINSGIILDKRAILIADPKRSDSTVNRYMASLSALFTYAAGEWGWMQENPCRKVKRLKEPSGRVRFLSDVERVALIASCDAQNTHPEMKLIVLLAITTGMRRGEILNLRRKDICLKSSTIYLWKTKNKDTRAVPLVGPAREQMLRWLESKNYMNNSLLFPHHKSSKINEPFAMDAIWKNIKEKAGLTDFKFHDLRHTAASYLAMNGAGLREIGDILGHKTLSMVQRYSHFTSDHRHKTVEKMALAIFGGAQ